jgi:hypothetical protein
MLLTKLFSGRDNETPDIARWSWAISTAAVIGAAVLNWLHNVTIDITSLGLALGGIAAAHGVAIKAKEDSEPTGAK